MSLKSATREFAREVEREAERLIGEGVPPWDAVDRGRRIVSERRRRATEREGFADAAVIAVAARRMK